MTRKHFVALATEISAISDYDVRVAAYEAVVRAVAQFNANFDHDRFRRACGI